MSRDLSVMEPGRMAWPGLTPFRFDRTQDRGNGKNPCRHHPRHRRGKSGPRATIGTERVWVTW